MTGWRAAFSLSGEAVKASTPPGTVTLVEHNLDAGHQDDRVVPVPLPTSSPADPLNWSRWRKVACMVTLAFYAFVANYLSASMAPALPVWNLEFRHDHRPLKDLMELVAFNVLVLGLGNIFWVPLSNVFGRRLVLVVSTFVLSAATTCGMFVTGFEATLIIRIFQGLGSSASETVTPAVVGDLFFVHERGSWMAFYTASLASGSVLGGITGGYVAHELGWIRQFSVGAVLAGISHVAMVLLVPETMFDRPRHALPMDQPTLSSSPSATRHSPIPRIPSVAPRVSLVALPSPRFTMPPRYSWARAIELETRAAPGEAPSAAIGSSSRVPRSWRYAGIWSPPRFSVASSHATIWPVVFPRSSVLPAASGAKTGPSSAPTPTPENAPGMTWYDTESSVELATASGRSAWSNGGRANGMLRGGAGEGSSSQGEEAAADAFTFVRSLRFGRYRGDLLRQFGKPWTTLLLPATWVVMLQYGGLVGGVAVVSTVGPQVLSQRPYRWGEHAGLLFVGAFVGILVGGLWTGLVADKRLKKLARDEEHGYAEPEARIGVMVPSLLVGTCGLLVFGFCAQYPGRYQWIGLEFAYGMVAFALTQVPSIWFGYLIDSYDQLASDCFVMICILRGLISFAWTFFVAQWVEKDGFLIPFGGFTAIMGVFALLTTPIIFWGKRMRIATAHYVEGHQ